MHKPSKFARGRPGFDNDVARKLTFGFAPIAAIEQTSVTSPKRTLPQFACRFHRLQPTSRPRAVPEDSVAEHCAVPFGEADPVEACLRGPGFATILVDASDSATGLAAGDGTAHALACPPPVHRSRGCQFHMAASGPSSRRAALRLDRRATECAGCPVGEAMCRIPCWGTPRDALVLIKRGLGHRLMAISVILPDYTVVRLLTPGFADTLGRFRQTSDLASLPDGTACSFFNQGSRRCMVHSAKPLEGRVACCAGGIEDGLALRDGIALYWRSPGAQRLVSWWAKQYRMEVSCSVENLYERAARCVADAVILRRGRCHPKGLAGRSK